MLPRALLFSSDEQTTGLLTQALAELAIPVEACPDIFAAVEKLTTRNYQIIIADWTPSVEAGFFLKAARELVFSQATFTLAVVRERDTAAVFQTGVNGILAKPIIAEQAKNTFLAALNAISGAPSSGEQELSTDMQKDSDPAPAAEPALQVEPHKPAESAQTDRQYAFEDSALPRRPLSFAGYAEQPDSKHLGRRLAAVAVVAAVAGITLGAWKMGYRIATGTMRRISSSIAKAAEAKPGPDLPQSATTQAAATPPEHEAQTAPYGFDDDTVKNKPISRAQIRVRPVLPVLQSTKSRPAVRLASESSESTVAFAPSVNPEIPDSLSVPVQTMAAHAAAPRPRAASNRWTPLELPEEISRQLVVHRVLPIYPAKAIAAGLQGAVVLQAWVGQDGSIRDLKLVRGYLVLGEAAFQAVKQWRYQPYRLNGEIVEMQTFITVDFQGP